MVMNETYLSVFHSISKRTHRESARETVSLPRLVMLSTHFFVSSKRLYDI